MLGTTSAASSGSQGRRRYPLCEPLFKTALNKAMCDGLFLKRTLKERQDVRLKSGFDTACWAFVPPHKIFVGTDILEKPFVRDGLEERAQQKYVANHYHHEVGHGLFTLRDMAALQQAVRKIRAPFSLLNLFEDGRMEARYRSECGYQFEWLTFEDFSFSQRPESLLFALVQAEGDFSLVDAALAGWGGLSSTDTTARPSATDPDKTRGQLQTWLPAVVAYYRRALAAQETLGLMPVLEDWIREFGVPPSPPQSGMGSPRGAGQGELETSAALMSNPLILEAFEQGTAPIKPSEEPESGRCPKTELDTSSFVARSGEVLGPRDHEVDQERAQRLASKLSKLFEQRTRQVSTLSAQKRVSARHFAIGRPPYRKELKTGRTRPTVLLEVDCSGSMAGLHIAEGRLLIAALSLLAASGRVTGHVLLSAVREMRPQWELHKLPMRWQDIRRVAGYADAEGLQYALEQNLALAKAADHVFVYTDAQICDKPMDKALLHRQGIYTWGLYAGEPEGVLASLMQYFDKALIRGDAEALVDAMLAQVA
jgi:hypothetical protein